MIHSLTRGFETDVDDVDDDLFENCWHASVHDDRVYATRVLYPDRKTLRLHRVIFERMIGRNLLTNEDVDHRNNDPLNNHRHNLRLADNSQNSANSRIRPNNTSGYKGVSLKTFSSGNKKWCAAIRKGKSIHIGYFDTPEKAAMAYDAKAVELFGEFSATNAMLGAYK